ncbi:MAG TPA: N-acetylmuramoyl-L-alanine amidase [Devosia sp.]
MFRTATASILATGQAAGSQPEFGSGAPHFKPLGMLLPIGNRKVETRGGAPVFDCARGSRNLLLTFNLHNAQESPEPSGLLADLHMGSISALFNSGGFGGQAAGRVRSLLVVLMVLASAFPAWAQTAPAVEDPRGGVSTLPEVLDARVTATPERARLILDLSGPTEFAIVSLSGPDRIAVDVRSTGTRIGVPADVAGGGIVSKYVVEPAEPGRVRTTLELATPSQVQQAYILDAVADQPARLVVDLVTDTPERFAARVAADLAASAANQGVPPEALSTDPGTHGDVLAVRPLVVIDPGHGGVDNGASAPNGVHEKDITLAFALDLQKLLVESGRFDVALTREDDTYITLNERVALARANKADLFISLHADTFQQPEIRGASVYTRDENATDVLDKVLADNENKYDIVAGFAVPSTEPVVVDILVDLMRREMRKSSFIAAKAFVSQLEPSVAMRRFPVRQADFFVLQAPDVPSVLVELGFLSNASDIANLQKSDWRKRVVEALARGVAQYFDEVQTTPSS